MTDTITTLEAEIAGAGQEPEREYVFGELDTRDGGGWLVRVEGELLATRASVRQAGAGLRGWWESGGGQR